MPKMKLGYWRDKRGVIHEVSILAPNHEQKWRAPDGFSAWDDKGRSFVRPYYDLVEFIRPLDTELPPTLNAAVKAAEDRVRELKRMVDETQTAWATACRLHEAAQKELERLEKECEVGK